MLSTRPARRGVLAAAALSSLLVLPAQAAQPGVNLSRVTVTAADRTQPLSAGSGLTVAFRVLNRGSRTAAAAEARVNLVTGTSGAGNTYYRLGATTVRALGARQAATATVSGAVPADIRPGQYAVSVCLGSGPRVRCARGKAGVSVVAAKSGGATAGGGTTTPTTPATPAKTTPTTPTTPTVPTTGGGRLTATGSGTFSGTTPAGKSSPGQVFIFSNDGTAALAQPTISLGGADAGQFAIAATTCTVPLAAGASCTALVSFAPTSPGDKVATLNADAGPGSTLSIPLSGTASAAPTAAFAVTSVGDFGKVATGLTSGTATLSVSNTTAINATDLDISLVGADASQFRLDRNTCGATLRGGDGCSVKVTFAPSTRGAKSASLRTVDGLGTPTLTALSGTGATPAAITVDKTSLSFPWTQAQSPTQTLTFTNTGEVPTGIVSAIALGDVTKFGRTGSFTCLDGPLAPGATCTWTIFHTGNSTGADSVTYGLSATPGGAATVSVTSVPPT